MKINVEQIKSVKEKSCSVSIQNSGVPCAGSLGAAVGPDLPDWLHLHHPDHSPGEAQLCHQVLGTFIILWTKYTFTTSVFALSTSSLYIYVIIM